MREKERKCHAKFFNYYLLKTHLTLKAVGDYSHGPAADFLHATAQIWQDPLSRRCVIFLGVQSANKISKI